MHSFSIYLLAVGLLLCTACDWQAEDVGVTETETGRLMLGSAEEERTAERSVSLEGRTLVLDGLDGDVNLQGVRGDRANLTFTRLGRGADPDDARRVAGTISLEEAGSEEQFQYMLRAEEPKLSRVNIKGEVPARAPLNIKMAHADIRIDSVQAPLVIQSEHGPVHVQQAAGTVSVQLANGSIYLSLTEVGSDDEVSLKTKNGDITLRLPADSEASVNAFTGTGEILTRNLTFEDKTLDREGSGYEFSGVLNEGGASISLSTQNGTITITSLDAEEENGVEHRAFPEELFPVDPAPPQNQNGPDTD